MVQFVLTMVPLCVVLAGALTILTGGALVPANVDGCRRSLLACLATCSRSVDFSLQVSTHNDACHDHCSPAEHDVGFALDVSFAGDLVACVLEDMSVLLVILEQANSLPKTDPHGEPRGIYIYTWSRVVTQLTYRFDVLGSHRAPVGGWSRHGVRQLFVWCYHCYKE